MAPSQVKAAEPSVPLIDGHIHFVDFLQDTDGIHALVQRMDEAGVARAVIFGMPLAKKWDAFDRREPRYYLDDDAKCYYYSYTDQLVTAAWESLPAEQRTRFAPLMCGFNPTDKHAVRHLERMYQRYRWRGVGEVLLRHDDLTNLTLEEIARANHPAMTPVYEFCTTHDLPILLHQNYSSVGCHDEYLYLHELEEVLVRNPKLVVVWAHCGLSPRVCHDAYHEKIEHLLHTYPRLHVDLSWAAYDHVIRSGGRFRSQWLDLVERFADQVLLGSDLVGHFDNLGKTMHRYQRLLGELSDAARRKVAWSTAERIYFSGPE